MSDPRYANLEFSTGMDGNSLLLKSRAYSYPNTAFSMELGNTVALGTVTRMHRSPQFNQYRWAALATLDAFECDTTQSWTSIVSKVDRFYADSVSSHFSDQPEEFVKAFRLLGIDPNLELSLENDVPSLSVPSVERTYGKWESGAYRLDQAVAFSLWNERVSEDPELSSHFGNLEDTFSQISHWINLSGFPRAQILKNSQPPYNFNDVFDPITNSQKQHEFLCRYFADQL